MAAVALSAVLPGSLVVGVVDRATAALVLLVVVGASAFQEVAGEQRYGWRLVSVGIAGLVAATQVGRLLGLVVAVCLVLTDMAIRGRHLVPSWRKPGASIQPVIAVLIVVAAWRARGGDAVSVVVVWLVMSAVAVTVGMFGDDHFKRVTRTVRRWVGVLMSPILFSVLAVPAVLLPWLSQRLLRVDPLREESSSGPGWETSPAQGLNPASAWAAESAQRAEGKWARTRTTLAGALSGVLVTGTALALVIAVVGLGQRLPSWRGAEMSGPSALNGANTDPDVTPAAFKDSPWYFEYQQDIAWLWQTSVAWDPLAPVRLKDVRTRHINISDGARHTWAPSPCSCTRVSVWVYGGSTTFGLGQRDEYTIPSYLARKAAEDDVVLDVVNRGVVGDTVWEEAQRFAWDLATLPEPNLVVFLDGINDGQAVDRLVVQTRQPMNFVKDDFWRNYLERARDIGIDPRWAPAGDPNGGGAPPGALLPDPVKFEPTGAHDLGVEIARRYEVGRQMSEDVAASKAVPVEWVWQPSIEFRPTVRGEPPPEGRDFARARTATALSMVDRRVHDLSGVLGEAEEEPLYWDSYHTNERGAEIIGGSLYDQLAPRLHLFVAQVEGE